MTEAHQAALVSWLIQNPALVALVGTAITWDNLEDDLQMPAVTLRLLSTRIPARHLSGRGGIRVGLVELAAHSTTVTGSAQLLDAAVVALDPLEEGPTRIGAVTFGGVHLDDVTQSSPFARGRYRKAARYIVHAYE